MAPPAGAWEQGCALGSFWQGRRCENAHVCQGSGWRSRRPGSVCSERAPKMIKQLAAPVGRLSSGRTCGPALGQGSELPLCKPNRPRLAEAARQCRAVTVTLPAQGSKHTAPRWKLGCHASPRGFRATVLISGYSVLAVEGGSQANPLMPFFTWARTILGPIYIPLPPSASSLLVPGK